jgi:predicted O-methyltransferase YrrM
MGIEGGNCAELHATATPGRVLSIVDLRGTSCVCPLHETVTGHRTYTTTDQASERHRNAGVHFASAGVRRMVDRIAVNLTRLW